MKPELTFRRSLRLIMKRWWLMALCGVLVAALAFVVAGDRKGHYVATTVLTINDVTVAANPTGPGLALLPANPKFPTDWVTDDFLSLPAAQTASKLLGGSPSASKLLDGITPTPLATNKIQLDYTGGSDEAQSIEVLRQYATVFINQRELTQKKAISTAVNQLDDQITALENLPDRNPQPLQRNKVAFENAIPQLDSAFGTGFETHPEGSATLVKSGGPGGVIAAIGGLLAGAAFGALLALILGRLDRRVRRPDDIEVTGVPVVDIDSDTDAASVQLLRSELELAGMGTRLGVIAVTRATRDEGSSGLALALARTFAGVGTPTILVSADLRARPVRSEAGMSGLLDGSVGQPPIVKLDQNLGWLPEGSSDASPDTLFSAPRVERIIRDLRDQAGVVVIDAPAVLEDSETLPLLACSDIVLLAVRPDRTSWNPLGSAVALIQRVAKRPLHICYDRAEEASSVPAMATRRSDVADRVAQAIEVPAGS